jgi:hypothetical protein
MKTQTKISPKNFEAAITMEEVKLSEELESIWAQKRRGALASLTRNKQQLVQGFIAGDGIETLLELVQHTQEWRDHLKVQLDMADLAAQRLLVAAGTVMELKAAL